MTPRPALLALAFAAAPLAANAAVGPDYHRPDIVLTPSYHAAPPATPGAIAPPLDAPPLDTWWDGFGDPELSRVVARAQP
ncbi:MAG: hypothetical protein WDM85_01675 [Caulobacteraceae bacterium]